ncbi:MAG TPA: hypothetical protein VHT03_02415 [Rhizomicrobium sp.]|jgi:hypothetical protein|nr:hypothetical protein [Rhizomicrobium sp.]
MHLGRATALFALMMSVSTDPTVAAQVRTIAADIQIHGAGPVVQRLDKAGDYDRVLNRIRSGSAEWVRLAFNLVPGTDGARAEDLQTAIGVALSHNPKLVLSLLATSSSGLSVEDVCNPPFIDETPEQVRWWARTARAAIRMVTEPELQNSKRRCLAEIATAQKHHTSE